MDDLNAFTPEEGDVEHHLLTEQLRRMFDTHAEDAASLARTRVRLLQNSIDALPHFRPAPSNRRREGKRNMQFIHVAIYERRAWQQRLTTIAAVFFIVILVGSLAMILLHRQQSNMANPPPLRSGWTQAVYLSGSGSQTFTHLHITLSTLWGETDSCTGGNGNLDIRLQLKSMLYETGGTCPRTSPPSSLVGPGQINLESSAQMLDTITVKAPGSINWFLQLSNANVTPTPVLSRFTAPHSGWVNVTSVGGGYSYDSRGFTKSTVEFEVARSITALNPPGGSSTVWKALAFISICIGNGGMTIQVTPPAPQETLATAVCDGQPHLKMADPNIQTVTAIGNKGVVWRLYIFGCTSAKGCN